MDKAIILIIDHDSSRRKTLADLVTAGGHQTLTAETGAEGLGLLLRYRVALILLDLGPADLPTPELIFRITADFPLTQLILLTDDTSLEAAREATRRGAFCYLIKPYDFDSLQLHVRRAIEQRQTEEALRRSEAKFRTLLESAPDGIVLFDGERKILTVNRQFEAMSGYDRAEVIGNHVGRFIHSGTSQHQNRGGKDIFDPQMSGAGKGGKSYTLRKDGSKFPVDVSLTPLETSKGMAVAATLRDVTERHHYEARLEYLANHDALTGLPNRNLLIDRLGQAMLYGKRLQRQVAVLFVDLDHFKFINDSLGLDIGDRLLRVIAERLRTCVRANDTVARQGGDDFVIVLGDLAASEDAAIVAQKLHEIVRQPLEIDSHSFEITCSIGISLHPKDGQDAQTLLKNADAAMFRAKERGRGTFQFFIGELNDRVVARMTMEKNLRRALENEELSLHYQPQMDLASGKMTGIEALLRWQNPELGMVAPAGFIPLAEETGLIIPIGEWVLQTACRQNRQWQEAGFPPLVMAVNLSPRQFSDPNLIATVSRVLHDSGLAPPCLELEITEGMVMLDIEETLAVLNELKGLGIQLSIDDFGTGYSSLSHLKRFPFDKLKMDISFVREVTHDPGSAAIARTIIALGHNLNLRVLAEGIETEGQLSYLKNHGCDEMQGFYFSRPLPQSDLRQLLVAGRRLLFPKESTSQPTRTLLLVDDEPYIIATMKRVLREDGYLILSAANAAEGFELLATNRVGVVLSDQRMPGMTGIEFLSRVSRLHPETIRIAMSGYADMAMVTSAINEGAIYKFLTKPFDNDMLRQSIATAFKRFEEATRETGR
jgi:diguanylate cyclase (GGDEF)-like protein/PAS domain S-box-containing protein